MPVPSVTVWVVDARALTDTRTPGTGAAGLVGDAQAERGPVTGERPREPVNPQRDPARRAVRVSGEAQLCG